MRVVVEADERAVGRRAADVVAAAITGLAEPVIGVATGASPRALYEELARRVAAGELELSRARVFALDEYLGLAAADPRSYAATVRRTVTEPLRLDPSRVRVPPGDAVDPETAASDYEAAIAAAGGVDVQVLGIGANGHLAFNEPGSPLDSRTGVTTLSPGTRKDNSRFFASPAEVPTRSITQGLGTILEARRLVLVALGAGKAPALARALTGPVSEDCPASIVQAHPAATIVLDAAAASLIPVGMLREPALS